MQSGVSPTTVVLALVAGCGGGSNASETAVDTSTSSSTRTLSVEQYAEDADRLCRELLRRLAPVQQQLHRLRRDTGSDEERLQRAAALFERQLATTRSFHRAFDALGRPAAHAEDVGRALALIGAAEDQMAEVIEAAQNGNAEEFASAMERYAGSSLESAQVLADSGLPFSNCANP